MLALVPLDQSPEIGFISVWINFFQSFGHRHSISILCRQLHINKYTKAKRSELCFEDLSGFMSYAVTFVCTKQLVVVNNYRCLDSYLHRPLIDRVINNRINTRSVLCWLLAFVHTRNWKVRSMVSSLFLFSFWLALANARWVKNIQCLQKWELEGQCTKDRASRSMCR